MSLIFLLFNVTSAQEVPFGTLQYMQCILHGLTSVLLCVPFIFADSKMCWLYNCTWLLPLHKSHIFIVATLITEVLFLISNDSYCCVTSHRFCMKNATCYSYINFCLKVRCPLRYLVRYVQGLTSQYIDLQ